jgi:putative peptidoglycan lipid II flippase
MSTRLARSAGLIGAATMTSRVLALGRETVIAYLFGAGNAMDAYNVAFRVPNLLRDLFAEGAISAAFIPTFTRYLSTRGRDAAWRLGNLVVNTLAVVTLACVVAGWFLAPDLARWFAPQYALVPGKLELTTLLTRIMLPFLTMIAVGVVMMGMLNALGRFFIPALSPAMFNIATLLSAFTLVPLMPRLGWPRIAGIAVGTVIGGAGQCLLQWPVLRREGWRYAAIFDTRDQGLREVMRLMAPGTLGLAAVKELFLTVDRYGSPSANLPKRSPRGARSKLFLWTEFERKSNSSNNPHRKEVISCKCSFLSSLHLQSSRSSPASVLFHSKAHMS